MPEKKRQHIVPLFYLKYFSTDKKQKTINIFNIASNKLISAEKLKTQASKNYFYGKNRIIEDSIGDIESMGAGIISRMNMCNTLPKRYSENHYILIAFVLLMQSRTEFAAEVVNEMHEKLFKMTYSPDPKERASIDKLKIEMRNPALLSICVNLSSRDLAGDLKYKLILNKTKTPFITSDNPVIFYNQFMEIKGASGYGIAIASTGLQVFFPVSPLHYLVLYDDKIYKIGVKGEDVFEIYEHYDVDALNRLQYYNAYENLFFNHAFNRNHLSALLQSTRKRREEKTSIREFKPINKKSHEDSSIFIQNKVGIKCNLKLSFAKLLKKAENFELGYKAAHYRNEKMCQLFFDYMELVIQKKLLPDKFRDYLKDNGINVTQP